MVVQFYNSSALVKRYIREPGTAWVRAQTDPALGNELHVLRITRVEVTAALARLRRGGHLSTTGLTSAITSLSRDLGATFRVFEVTPTLLDDAARIAEAHGLRAYDAVQLAGALAVSRVTPGGLVLVSADLELNAAALAEGLLVEDPNAHP